MDKTRCHRCQFHFKHENSFLCLPCKEISKEKRRIFHDSWEGRLHRASLEKARTLKKKQKEAQ